MESWLDRLKQKPRMVRQQIAFSGAVVLTSVVVLLWSLSLPTRFNQIAEAPSPIVPEEATSNMQNFMASVRDQMATAVEALRAEEPVSATTTDTDTEIAEAEQEPTEVATTSTSSTATTTGRTILIATTTSSVSVPGTLPTVE